MIEGLDDMTDSERRDAIWGLRNGCAAHMNRVRRESFESVKMLLVDRCAMLRKINPPPANVVALADYSGLQNVANNWGHQVTAHMIPGFWAP